jgi:hypothetical protein
MFFFFSYYFNWISFGLLLLWVDELNVVTWVDYVEIKLFFFADDDLLLFGWIGSLLIMFLLTYNNDFIMLDFGYDLILDFPFIIYSFNKFLNS